MRRTLSLLLAGTLLGGLVFGTGTALATHTFPDVPDGAFYSDAVDWAYDEGITTGYGSTGEFRPDLPTTRGQMVTFLQRLHRTVGGSTYSAVVRGGGTLARGSDGLTATKLTTGQYEIDLGRTITACTFTASIGEAGATATGFGTIQAAIRAGSTEKVWVGTADTDGTFTDKPFHLLVHCPA